MRIPGSCTDAENGGAGIPAGKIRTAKTSTSLGPPEVNMKLRRRFLFAAGAAALPILSRIASARHPSRPVRIIVPVAARSTFWRA
jgi:hypothetical protein